MWSRSTFVVRLAFALCIAGAAPLSAEEFLFEAIALTGDSVPSRSGETFTGFDVPVVNARGDVAFAANFGSTRGVFATRRNSLRALALAGDEAPGGNGLFEDFGSPVLNRSGAAAFLAVSDGSFGLFATHRGRLQAIAVEGDPAPGTDGDTFTDFSRPLLNSRGDVAFVSGHGGTEGVFATRRGTLIGVAPGGTPAPGTDGVFTGTGVPLSLNDAGSVALSASADGTSGIWINRGGKKLVAVVVSGQSAPGGGGTFQTPGAPALNDRSGLAFVEFGDTARGIYSGRIGGLRPIALEGDPAPGSTDTFASFGGVVLNRSGSVAFTAEINGSQGIFASRRGSVHAVALLGDPAPGTTKTFRFLGEPLLTGNGHVAFVASLTEVSGGFTDPGLFVGGPDPDELSKVVAAGDLIEVAPDDLREVRSLGFSAGSGNQDGRASGFNDRGQAGVLLHFVDGTSGIFVARPQTTKNRSATRGVLEDPSY